MAHSKEKPAGGQGGFTLPEILVVLIIVGLVSGILLQALQQVFRLQRHFGSELTHIQQGAMFSDWFRQAVQGLQPDYADGKNKFAGTERRFSGLTTNPLTQDYGAPTPFGFELVYDAAGGETSLRYGSGKDAPVILAWQGNQGRFVYRDAQGEPHDSWPPPLGKWPQLPDSIQLEAARDGLPWLVAAVPMGPVEPQLRIRDIMGGVQ